MSPTQGRIYAPFCAQQPLLLVQRIIAFFVPYQLALHALPLVLATLLW